jgi:hypothetical protein
MVLISLSEEYMDAAHKLGPRVGLLGEMADVETYNGLVAAGLGCLEACLKVRLHVQSPWTAQKPSLIKLFESFCRTSSFRRAWRLL